jgi:hypothetical protein
MEVLVNPGRGRLKAQYEALLEARKGELPDRQRRVLQRANCHLSVS